MYALDEQGSLVVEYKTPEIELLGLKPISVVLCP